MRSTHITTNIPNVGHAVEKHYSANINYETASVSEGYSAYFCLPIYDILRLFNKCWSNSNVRDEVNKETIHSGTIKSSVIEIKKIKKFSTTDMEKLNDESRHSSRLRSVYLFHNSPAEPVQRFLNAMQPGTYVPIHKHCGDNRWELFVLIQGAAVVLMFDDNGKVIDRTILSEESGIKAIEIPKNTYHTVACTSPNTILFEIKYGAYNPVTDKQFAPWTPAEGHSFSQSFVQWYTTANLDDSAADFYQGLENESPQQEFRL